MPARRRSLAHVVWPLVWPLLGAVVGCQFTAQGLGSTTSIDLGSTGGTTGRTTGEPPDTSSTTGDATTGDATTGAADSTGSTSTTGEPCAEACPPMVDWTVTVDGVGQALVLGDGDAFVAGEQAQLSDTDLRDVWAARFAGGDGDVVWRQRHNGAEKRTDFARGLALTRDGTAVIVVGGSQESKNRRIDVWAGWLAIDDGVVLAESNLATAQWNGAELEVDEWAHGIASDEQGDLFVVGRRCLSPCELPEAWIGRFAADGAPVWEEPMLYAGQGSLRALVLHDATMYAVGTDGFMDAMAPWRTLIRRYDNTGGGIWSALQEDDEVGFEALAAALAADGGLWVGGRELDPSGSGGGFLRLYAPDRDDEPVVELRGEALGGELTAISLADDDTPVVAGAVGDGADRHLWLARFARVTDRELAPTWRIDERADEVSEARGVAHDGAGGLIVLGHAPARPDAAPSTWLRRYSEAAAPP